MRALDLVARWPVANAAAGVLVTSGASPGERHPGERHPGERHPGERHPGGELGSDLRPLSPQGGAVVTAGATGDVTRSYPWASVTKLCTALAVLVAIEEGTVALEDPAGPPGSTVAHLLSHASGLAPDRRDALAVPGSRRIYSNAGFEVLAEAVAARAAMPFAEYLAEAVLEPLGMRGAALAPGASPAWGISGTLQDLLALGAELLRPTLIAHETLARATSVAFPGLAGVLPGYGLQDPCDWGLGFEIRDGKRPHWTGSHCSPATFGHFGRSGSFLWVDPDAGVAAAALCDRTWGSWTNAVWPAFSDAVLEAAAAARPKWDAAGQPPVADGGARGSPKGG